MNKPQECIWDLEIELPMDVTSGIFYTFDFGYFLPFQDMGVAQDLVIKQVDVECMFNIYRVFLLVSEWTTPVLVGLLFTSPLGVVNHGGFLLAGSVADIELTGYDVALRDKKAVIYNYPGKAALAISPQLSTQVADIFEYQ
jgi:hypothetical protein